MTTENISIEPDKLDSTLESFDNFLKETGDGYTLIITRTSPPSLAGYLEEIPIHDSNNPINLRYLADTWGGDVLSLSLRGLDGKFHKRMILEMRSYPPKLYGVPIPAGGGRAQPERLDPMDIVKMSRELMPPPIPQRDMLSEIAPILKIIMDRVQPPQPPPPSPAANIMDIMSALGAMRDFVQPPPEGGDAIATSLARVAEVFMTSQMSKPQIQSSSPRPHVVASQPQIQAQPPPQPLPQPKIEPEGDDIIKIMREKLAGMSGEQVSYLYLDVLENMSDDKREEALEILDKEIGMDDKDEDEKPTDSISTSISGKQPVPSPRDSTGDRKGDKKIG